MERWNYSRAKRILESSNPRKRNFLLSSGELELRETERDPVKNSTKFRKEDVNFHQKSKDERILVSEKKNIQLYHIIYIIIHYIILYYYTLHTKIYKYYITFLLSSELELRGESWIELDPKIHVFQTRDTLIELKIRIISLQYEDVSSCQLN